MKRTPSRGSWPRDSSNKPGNSPRDSGKKPGGPNKSTPAQPSGMFRRVLATVRRIPKGKVATYGDVARASGYPGAARQVVWALRTGRDVPWHRVLGAGGKILLTGEHALEQQLRLRAERIEVQSGRVDLAKFAHRFKEASLD